MVTGPTFVHHSKATPGSRRLTVQTAGRWPGWVMPGPAAHRQRAVVEALDLGDGGGELGPPLDVEGEGPDPLDLGLDEQLASRNVFVVMDTTMYQMVHSRQEGFRGTELP